jgi:hypothetical protein
MDNLAGILAVVRKRLKVKFQAHAIELG